MKLLVTCLLCLLLDRLVTPGAECQILEQSMEIRNPDIDPSWYTGRGIRPVGRFGRRRAAGRHDQKSGHKYWPDCIPALEESLRDE